MSAVERLAEAVLDGRVRVVMELETNGLGIPSGAVFHLDVDPVDEDLDEGAVDTDLS